MSLEIGREYREYFIENLRYVHLSECYHLLAGHVGLEVFAKMCVEIGGNSKGVPHIKSIKPILHQYIKNHQSSEINKLAKELNMSREYIAKVIRK